jgi:hypothetical protein
MNRNSTIGRIHQLKSLLCLDEDTYRTILASCSNGKTSCKEIDDEYLNLIKQSLEGQLQKQGTPAPKHAKEHGKIAKLGYLLCWSWFDIAHFVQRQTEGRKISTQSCDAQELQKVINGMTAMINDGLASGSLKLNSRDLKEFLRYTQSTSRHASA